MPLVFENNMGHIHIWKKACPMTKVKIGGLHNSLTTCDGKESDIYIQNNPELWKKRNLTRAQINEIDSGYPIVKRKIADFDD